MTDIKQLLVDIEKVYTDDEVVTQARLSKVTLPSGKVLGLVTLDNGLDHTRPNTFGPKGLVELNTAYDAALADDTIDAIAVTGKPFILAAGADLNTFKQAPTEGVRTIAELGHAVFRKLADGNGVARSRRSASSTVSPSAVASRSRCTPTTAPSSRPCRPSVCPRSCSASSPDGVAPGCCRT